jgi:hypothetical protein
VAFEKGYAQIVELLLLKNEIRSLRVKNHELLSMMIKKGTQRGIERVFVLLFKEKPSLFQIDEGDAQIIRDCRESFGYRLSLETAKRKRDCLETFWNQLFHLPYDTI